nr:PREDICTED: cytochrome P450 71D10-like isoform X2 [Daucus carota subsp. sativus]
MILYLWYANAVTPSSGKSKLPPGPWKLPFIGNIHQLVGSQTHHILRDLAHKYGPIMSLKFGEVSAIIVSSPEVAQEILKTHDLHFAQRPYFLSGEIIAYNFSNIVFSPYGEYWRTLRKICTMELFSVKSVQKFRHIRESEVSNLIKTISQNLGSTINLGKEFFTLTIGITARAGFGKRVGEEKVFAVLIQELVDLSSGFSVADMYPSVKFLHLISRVRPRLEKVYKGMDKVFGDIISEHRKRSVAADEEDLADVLLRVQKDGLLECPLTDDNIKAVILDIITAGSETSTATMIWAMSELIKNPKVMERAQAEVSEVFKGRETVDETGLDELNYLKLVIKETLRLHPPAPMLIPRECREQCQINGFDIPVKSKVIFNAWAIGRDPRFWDDSESFKPERFQDSPVDFKGTDFQYIPFGAGRRICPGISFAHPNIMLGLAQVLYHFDWKLPGGIKNEELDMTEEFGITLRRKQELNVIPIARKTYPME